jgi:hypothetical protein
VPSSDIVIDLQSREIGTSLKRVCARRVKLVNHPGPRSIVSYLPDPHDLSRRAAFQVDRIFKSENPANLQPVEQPTKFEFVINLTTTKAFSLEISATLIALTDVMIE